MGRDSCRGGAHAVGKLGEGLGLLQRQSRRREDENTVEGSVLQRAALAMESVSRIRKQVGAQGEWS